MSLKNEKYHESRYVLINICLVILTSKKQINHAEAITFQNNFARATTREHKNTLVICNRKNNNWNKKKSQETKVANSLVVVSGWYSQGGGEELRDQIHCYNWKKE